MSDGSELMPTGLAHLTRDAWLLFATRFTRLFAYGSLSVVLVFYLIGVGLSEPQTGMLLTLTLAGDTVVSLWITTRADRIGRKRMLLVGAALMVAAGLVFASTTSLWLLVLTSWPLGLMTPRVPAQHCSCASASVRWTYRPDSLTLWRSYRRTSGLQPLESPTKQCL